MSKSQANVYRHRYTYILILSIGILLLFLAVSLFFSSPALAVTISQPIVELNVQPGTIIDEVVQLYDDSKLGITVYPWVYNFTEDPEREGTAQLIYNPAELKPNRDWIKFEGNHLELPADGSLVDFPYRIEVPDDGEPGTHLLALTFRSRPPIQAELEGSTVYVGSNVVTSIFLKVAGEVLDKIDADFQAGTYLRRDPGLTPAELKKYFKVKKFFIKPPVEFLLTIYNQGNTHQKPDGNVRIVNTLFGGSPEKLLVNPENKIIGN